MSDVTITLTDDEIERIYADTEETLSFCLNGSPLHGERDTTAHTCVAILRKLPRPRNFECMDLDRAERRLAAFERGEDDDDE